MHLKNSTLSRVVVLLSASLLTLAYKPNNPENGTTGAPFNTSCAKSGCHSSQNTAFNGTAVLSGLPATIAPNTTYNLTLTATVTAGAPTRAGFQLVAVQGDNTNAGDLIVTNSTQTGTETYQTREYIEQRQPKNFAAGTLNWTFNWTSPATASGNTVKFYFAILFANGNGGDSGDRTITASQTYALAPPFTASIASTTNVSCFGGSNGAATATATGGAAYTYLWPNGQTTATATGLAAGTYTVTVTNAGTAATATATATIAQPPALGVSIDPPGSVTCANATVMLNAKAIGGTPPVLYQWSNGAVGPSPILSDGIWTVTVSDANGCSATATATIPLDITPPSVTATGWTLNCYTPTIDGRLHANVNGTGPFTFAWSGPNGFTSTEQNPFTMEVGNFTVTVTNVSNGCTATASAATNVDTQQPVATVIYSGVLTCATTSVALNVVSPTPGVTFAWSGPGGFVSSLQNISTSVPGTFFVTVTNPTNGCTSRSSVEVLQNITPPNAAASASQITCASPSATIAGNSSTPGATFAWSGPGGFVSQMQSLSVDFGGDFTLVVTDTINGCTASATASVVENTAPPTVQIAAPQNLNCHNATLQLDASASSSGANFAAEWTTADGQITAGANTLAPTVAAAGTYFLTISNAANGCASTSSVAVLQTLPLAASIVSAQNVSCHGGANGSASAIATGGAAGQLTYQWSNGSTAATAENLPAGVYSVVVSDAENCSASTGVVISQPDLLAANAAATAETAATAADGTATADPTGGTAPYAFLWSTGETTAAISGLAPGAYTVSVTDANGCLAAQTLTVNAFDCVINASLSTKNVRCFGLADGQIEALVVGGTAPFSYAWSNGATGPVAENLLASDYALSVTDAAGCVFVASASVTEPPLLASVVTNVTPATCPENYDGSATIAVAGGVLPYSYLWSDASAFDATNNALLPGTATVTISDANLCQSVQAIEIQSLDLVPPTLICPENLTTCEGGTSDFFEPQVTDNCLLPTTIFMTQTSGLPSGSVFPVGTTVNEFTATDKAGNTATCTFRVTVKALPQAVAVVTNDVNGAGLGSIDATIFGIAAPQIQWLGPNSFSATTEDISGLAAGIYTLSVQEVGGCPAQFQFEVKNTVGTAEAAENALLRLLPNPVSRAFRAEFSGGKIVAGRILDLRGRVVREIPQAAFSEKISAEGLPAGAYLLQIWTENGRTAAVKFVKTME